MLPSPHLPIPPKTGSINEGFMSIHSLTPPSIYPQNSLSKILKQVFLKFCFNELCLIFQLFSVFKPLVRWNDLMTD